MKLSSPGITLDLPAGWEAEIDGGAGDVAPEGETVITPRVHIANFPLPPVRGDFGSGAVERMIDGDVLICLLEESTSAVGSRLHDLQGLPQLRAGDFSPHAMQRPLQGQSGCQKFFHVDDRAFVVYVVMGSHHSRVALLDDVNAVAAGIKIPSR